MKKDPVEQFSQWSKEDHETYIPPVLMEGYEPVDSKASSANETFQHNLSISSRSIFCFASGALFAFVGYCLTVTSQISPLAAALSVIFGFIVAAFASNRG